MCCAKKTKADPQRIAMLMALGLALGAGCRASNPAFESETELPDAEAISDFNVGPGRPSPDAPAAQGSLIFMDAPGLAPASPRDGRQDLLFTDLRETELPRPDAPWGEDRPVLLDTPPATDVPLQIDGSPDIAMVTPDVAMAPPDVADALPDTAMTTPDLAPPLECSPWWRAPFATRLPLQITAGQENVEAGWWAQVTFDHQALVAAGRARADGLDVRVVRNTAGSFAPRPVFVDEQSQWGISTTKLWFQVESAIAAFQIDKSYALYVGDATAPATFVAPAAIYAGVFSGTATSASSGWTKAATPLFDPARSFVVFQTSHNNNRPVGSILQARLSNIGDLSFLRVTDEPVPGLIDIRYSVVSARAGIRVQRRVVSLAATPVNVSLSPLSSTNRAWLLWSKTADVASYDWSPNDPLWATLPALDTLQVRMSETYVDHESTVEIVEAPRPGDMDVQRGQTSLTNRNLTTTVTLPKAVDPTRSFVLVGFTTEGAGADVGSRMISAELMGGTSIRISRGLRGDLDDLAEIGWQVVQLGVGATVHSGSLDLAVGTRSTRVALSGPVATGRSLAFASVQAGGGQNMGSTTHAADDVIGVCSVTFALDATGFTATRNTAAADCRVGWQVVELPGYATATAEAREDRLPGCP